MPVTANDVRDFLRRRLQSETQEAAQRAARLRAAVPGLAAILHERFGAGRVWLFGSLAWGEPDGTADLDLAVEGLPPERYFPALNALLDAAPGAVDLVRLEEAPAGLRERILREGTVVRHEP